MWLQYMVPKPVAHHPGAYQQHCIYFSNRDGATHHQSEAADSLRAQGGQPHDHEARLQHKPTLAQSHLLQSGYITETHNISKKREVIYNNRDKRHILHISTIVQYNVM